MAVAVVGSRGRLAALLGLSRPTVHEWQRVPGRQVERVEQLTGVSRHVLRPDIYGWDEVVRELEPF
ncbi:MAG TPA: CI repressor [Gammaproteobacteria bacterium]|nr:CI repressor [Gammaproteobacteria bacterium]